MLRQGPRSRDSMYLIIIRIMLSSTPYFRLFNMKCSKFQQSMSPLSPMQCVQLPLQARNAELRRLRRKISTRWTQVVRGHLISQYHRSISGTLLGWATYAPEPRSQILTSPHETGDGDCILNPGCSFYANACAAWLKFTPWLDVPSYLQDQASGVGTYSLGRQSTFCPFPLLPSHPSRHLTSASDRQIWLCDRVPVAIVTRSMKVHIVIDLAAN